ncbi:unnamed protein product [Brassica napus]|uniref:(rape) hypothetical protein n=1 Tax=Brassica napus TaxID=3708 RepID=A0A816N2F6_BRANA|nr:unnamed protein product [Brassica napus]
MRCYITCNFIPLEHLWLYSYQITPLGPTSIDSVYKCPHAVSIYAIEVVDRETIALVKSTHGTELGDKGYFRVSLDTMLVEVPYKGKNAHRDFAQPCSLLSRFCFPKLPPREV